MTDDATYAFLSVLRRGLAALIAPGTPAADPRAGVAVSFKTGGSAVTTPALALRGPGDVAGFDPSVVRRTWPASGAHNAESNYFALAELADADLPWRYSPDATGGDRLMPWLCLIVLEDGEVGERLGATADRPLAAVTVTGPDALPDLTQAWAWAHAQILGAPNAPAADFDAAGVGALLRSAPTRASARLLCPRRLNAQTSYTAFVVPTFERGRLAGLGQAPSGVGRFEPAWTTPAATTTLPVYYSWGFQTGEAGDFASLVAQLHPLADVPDGVWQRTIALSTPGTNPPDWTEVELASALLPLGASVAAWRGLDANGFTKALASRTNAPGTQLAPPLYGRWLAAADTLSTARHAKPPWFHELNADPRARVAAGIGTTVVQAEQQELLAGAWAQVEGIRAVNERLRLSQFSREIALRLYARHITALDPQSLIQVSAQLHGRVRIGTTTAAAQLGASPIVPGALAPAWRRAARPLGTLGARQGRGVGATAAAPAASAMLTRLNSGALSVVPTTTAAPAPAGAAARLGDLAQVFSRVNLKPERIANVAVPTDFRLGISAGIVAVDVSAVAAATPVAMTDATAVHATAVHAMGSHPVLTSPVTTSPLNPLQMTTPPAVTALPTAAAAKFAAAAGTLMDTLMQPPAVGTTWIKADLDATTSAIHATLDPRVTIEQPLAARLAGVDAGPRRTDPIEPVLSAPAFPTPMYAPLVDAGREWLLPGLDQMPSDVIALFKTNWRFVESYLVGLNHELARKLLWNGYPTDQRATFFDRFWDVRGAGSGGLGAINAWTGALGTNRPPGSDPLVLLVRGELIRRYPNVVVHAAPAVITSGVREAGPDQVDPIFFGLIEPDIALFGFDVDPDVARGDPGWFFVLQEHPSEPRFGLAVPGDAFGDQPATWQGLGWDHLAANAGDLENLGYIDLTQALPLDPPTPDPTGSVWHANRSPASRAADIAHITFREPKRLEVHGSMLISAKGPPG